MERQSVLNAIQVNSISTHLYDKEKHLALCAWQKLSVHFCLRINVLGDIKGPYKLRINILMPAAAAKL